MKNTIKKSITVITVLAIALTLAMPMNAEAASKKAPKLNKSKVTLTITKKKTKPTYKLKVKNYNKRVKWTSTNKKVATVSNTGKVVAKKKGTAVVKVKVGKRTLKCKVVVKDTRKAKTPGTTPEHEHEWIELIVRRGPHKIKCTGIGCGLMFDTIEEWQTHNFDMSFNCGEGHGFTEYEIPIWVYHCATCGAEKSWGEEPVSGTEPTDHAHAWTIVNDITDVFACTCGIQFDTSEELKSHFLDMLWGHGDNSHHFDTASRYHYECYICGKRKSGNEDVPCF